LVSLETGDHRPVKSKGGVPNVSKSFFLEQLSFGRRFPPALFLPVMFLLHPFLRFRSLMVFRQVESWSGSTVPSSLQILVDCTSTSCFPFAPFSECSQSSGGRIAQILTLTNDPLFPDDERIVLPFPPRGLLSLLLPSGLGRLT